MVYYSGIRTWYVRSKLFKHSLAMPKHVLPRLAQSTLNDLQQNQHEKASLVCVRVRSPSGLALVPFALSMVDLSYDVESHTQTPAHTNIPGTE